MDIKNKLSTLWIVVIFNMVFADILSFMLPDFLTMIINGEMDIVITQELLLMFAIFLEIPILMIFLSRVLAYKANRLLNIVASFITILFVIGGGSLTCHYLFFASVEVVCLLFIMWYAFKWKGNL